MLIDFFMHLKSRRLPVTTTEYLALLEALQAGLADYSLDGFYSLSRLCMIKSEAHYDKFDVAFGEYFDNIHGKNGVSAEDALKELLNTAGSHIQSGENLFDLDVAEQDALRSETRKEQNNDEQEEEKSAPMKGGAGNNPLGEGGVQKEGIRIDNQLLGNRSAIKGWDSREFKTLDDESELNTRSIKIALRRLRKFAREGIHEELDLDNTIDSTARNAGWLDIKMRPERRNKVKVLIMFDIRGSMDVHIKLCKELFSAAKAEFNQLEWFYFHNIVCDSVWRQNDTHVASHYPLPYLMNRYGKDYKLIIVGDASMGPTELTEPGVSYSHNHSQESGAVWLTRLLDHYRQAVWLNPEPERYWHLTQSIGMLRDIMQNRMYPLTLSGLEQAMKVLGR